MLDDKASTYSELFTATLLLALLLYIWGMPFVGVLFFIALGLLAVGFMAGFEAAVDWVTERARLDVETRVARSRRGADLVPAAAPPGRGDEASPAGQAVGLGESELAWRNGYPDK